MQMPWAALAARPSPLPPLPHPRTDALEAKDVARPRDGLLPCGRHLRRDDDARAGCVRCDAAAGRVGPPSRSVGAAADQAKEEALPPHRLCIATGGAPHHAGHVCCRLLDRAVVARAGDAELPQLVGHGLDVLVAHPRQPLGGSPPVRGKVNDHAKAAAAPAAPRGRVCPGPGLSCKWKRRRPSRSSCTGSRRRWRRRPPAV